PHVYEGVRQVEGDGARAGGAEAPDLLAEGVSEISERSAQAGQRLGLEALRPEPPREPLPVQLAPRPEGQQREKPLAAAGAKAWHQGSVHARLERPEHTYAESRWRFLGRTHAGRSPTLA